MDLQFYSNLPLLLLCFQDLRFIHYEFKVNQ
jgi:hypothetical protein